MKELTMQAARSLSTSAVVNFIKSNTTAISAAAAVFCLAGACISNDFLTFVSAFAAISVLSIDKDYERA